MHTKMGRTDLAVEAREYITDLDGKLQGVHVKESYNEAKDITVTTVTIESESAADAMGKSVGKYITLEAPRLSEADSGYHREVSEELSKKIVEMFPSQNPEQSILVVGLGNHEVTADSLGPQVVGNLLITRHIIKEYGSKIYKKDKMHLISSIVPGVMAQTGMEVAEIVRGITEQTRPDIVIVIDALAARSIRRLNCTIQITDAGIQPGSGVGNNRNAMTKETLGADVIAIGIPTVVDAATIVNDALEKIASSELTFTSEEAAETFAELNRMYVTAKDIDETIKRLSFTVSEGLNIAFGGDNR